jgi:hypothetical protein
MTRKQWMFVALAVLLSGLSLYLNRDWFARDSIQISHRSMPPRPGFWGRRRPDDGAVNPVLFLFNRHVKLTSVKVVSVSDLETNKYPHAIWHLQSDSNSVPIQEFFYGLPIRGMRPAVTGIAAEPLQPGVNYRMLIEAGSQKAEHDFVPVPRAP